MNSINGIAEIPVLRNNARPLLGDVATITPDTTYGEIDNLGAIPIITVTANLHLSRRFTRESVIARYRDRYADEPLVRVLDDAPWVSRVANAHHVDIGGFALADDGHRLVVVAALDNLLKGAATQALQNLNLAFGFDEFAGIPVTPAA